MRKVRRAGRPRSVLTLASRRSRVRARHAEGDVVEALRGFRVEIHVEHPVGGGGVLGAVERAGGREGEGQGLPCQVGEGAAKFASSVRGIPSRRLSPQTAFCLV